MWAWSRGDGKGAFLGKLWGESKEDISVGFESRAGIQRFWSVFSRVGFEIRGNDEGSRIR